MSTATATATAAKTTDQLRELVAFEEKMMGELPLHLCRERIERVKSFYIDRQGLEAAKRIHGAMVVKLKARKPR